MIGVADRAGRYRRAAERDIHHHDQLVDGDAIVGTAVTNAERRGELLTRKRRPGSDGRSVMWACEERSAHQPKLRKPMHPPCADRAPAPLKDGHRTRPLQAVVLLPEQSRPSRAIAQERPEGKEKRQPGP